jgi:hypothetical protein
VLYQEVWKVEVWARPGEKGNELRAGALPVI